ncbi:MAG: Peptidase, M23/M37 family [Parcubacteria group bacterium GW2011_GWC1_45_9]|nr:MAG: Peptidase, M23/M37 family [Parcubacteria group bacterium GW2011_GWC1_45_9]HCI05276.1 hypothetical protein [Patescibacteria group bacterium]
MKNTLKTLFLFLLFSGFVFDFSRGQTTDELKNQILQREKEIEQLEKQAEIFRNEIDKNSSKAKTLNTEIAKINAQVNQLKNNIAITQKKIETTELEIREIGTDIGTAEESIRQNSEVLVGLIRQLNEMDAKDPLFILLESKKVSEIVQQLAYWDSLQENLVEKTNFLRALKNDLQQSLSNSQRKKDQYNTLAMVLAAQRTVADDQKQEKQTVLSQTKNQEQTYQKLLKETEEKQKQVEDEIFNLEQEMKKQLNLGSLPGRAKGLLMMPVSGGYITQDFGDVPVGSVTRKYYSFHNGIDFGAKTGIGTPILAAADGRVKAVGNNGKYAYGKWIAIDHGNNLVTLYAHLSYIGVKTPESVQKGQVIGYMGATGLALGPHLHFTLYAANTFKTESRWFGLLPLGAPLDPEDYL